MPLYDFHCRACGASFEDYTRADEQAPACPACASADTERVLTGFAGPFTLRPQGGDARRADAQRRAREDQKKERIAERIEARRQDS